MRRLPVPVLLAVVVLIGCGSAGKGSASGQSDRDRAVAEAMQAYHDAKASGTNLSTGPCIAERLPGLADWVADVAHDPRQPVDDQSSNQCQRYREGKAHHFVELDTSGNLIRAQ